MSRKTISATLFILLFAACTPAPVTEAPPLPAETAAPAIIPAETPVAPALSFEAAEYRDEDAGFAFDYPASWVADSAPQSGGGRGYYVQFTSWARDPNQPIDAVPAGETILQATVLLWDPTHALDQYVAQRKTAWEASGFAIVSEEELTLSGGWRALVFNVSTPDETAFFLFAELGDRYLELSGSGDLALLAEIAGTLRPIP